MIVFKLRANLFQKFLKYLVMLIIIYTPLTSFGYLEINNPIELVNYLYNKININILLVFDIDDTIIMNRHKALQANALDYLINKIVKNFGCSVDEAIGLIEFSLWNINEHLGEGVLVTDQLVHFFNEVTAKNSKFIAITNLKSGQIRLTLPQERKQRQLNTTCEDRRYQDLLKIGIDFSQSYINQFKNDKLELLNYKKNNIALFKNGIIVTSGYSKGECLLAFLKYIKPEPIEIVVIDNSLNNILSYEDVFNGTNIKITSIYFTWVNLMSQKHVKIAQLIADQLCKFKKWPKF